MGGHSSVMQIICNIFMVFLRKTFYSTHCERSQRLSSRGQPQKQPVLYC